MRILIFLLSFVWAAVVIGVLLWGSYEAWQAGGIGWRIFAVFLAVNGIKALWRLPHLIRF